MLNLITVIIIGSHFCINIIILLEIYYILLIVTSELLAVTSVLIDLLEIHY